MTTVTGPSSGIFPRPSNQADPKKWTVLLYSAADNDLYTYMVDDVAELERVGSDNLTNLVVQIDHGRQTKPELGAQRLYLPSPNPAGASAAPPTGSPIHAPVLEQLGQVNSASDRTLSQSIQWAMKNYPSEHFMVVISDHGNSWKGCISDNSSSGWMSIPTLKAALEDAYQHTGKRPDILGLDCCLMANTEAAYQLRDQADFMVASEMAEGANGWPYSPMLGPTTLRAMQGELAQRTDLSPRELAKHLVESTENSSDIHTLSAIDLAKVDEIKEPMIAFRKAMEQTDTPKPVLRDIWKTCTRFFGYRDAGDFAYWVANDSRITDENLKQAAHQAETSLASVVIAEQHSPEYEGATGLTLQVHRSTDRSYEQLEFEKDIHWTAAQDRVGKLDEPASLFELDRRDDQATLTSLTSKKAAA